MLKLVSSYFYMGLCANRHQPLEERMIVQHFLLIFELMFLLEMVLQFFRKVTPDGASRPLTTIQTISIHYMKTKFIWHFIPIIPFQYIDVIDNNTNTYFLLLKVIRMVDGLECYDVPTIMTFIKKR